MTETDPTGSTVHIVSIMHRTGTNLSAHTTESGAKRALAAFAREWWPEVAGRDGCPAEPPAGDDETARLYFDAHPDELAFTDAVTVEGDAGETPTTQPGEKPRIRKFLDLSTAHLPEQYGSERLAGAPGVTAYEFAYGWLMWVPDDPAESSAAGDEPVPAEILLVQLYARLHGCDYVLFDKDAETNTDLPTFDW